MFGRDGLRFYPAQFDCSSQNNQLCTGPAVCAKQLSCLGSCLLLGAGKGLSQQQVVLQYFQEEEKGFSDSIDPLADGDFASDDSELGEDGLGRGVVEGEAVEEDAGLYSGGCVAEGLALVP